MFVIKTKSKQVRFGLDENINIIEKYMGIDNQFM